MSKTASSAASVGMSFENTTAMIATMVEATRESATNIGSDEVDHKPYVRDESRTFPR